MITIHSLGFDLDVGIDLIIRRMISKQDYISNTIAFGYSMMDISIMKKVEHRCEF